MSSSIVIELNGVKINGRVDGTDNFSVTLRRREEDGGVARSYSSELTFYDDGYQIIKAALIDPAGGFNNTIEVKIYDTCCNQMVFEGIIYGTKIDWCEPGCSVTANIVEKEYVYNCIQTTLIYDNKYGFLNQNRLALNYCIEHRPLFIHILLLLLGGIIDLIFQITIWITFFVLVGPSTILYLMCKIINIFGANLSCNVVAPQHLFDDATNLIALVNSYLIPCGSYHPVAYVRDYIKNACRICGLNFKSSILNDPAGRVGSVYYDLALFSALVKRGRKSNETDLTLIQDNLPIETADTLFQRHLNPMFNAEYQIIGNDLVFERKDYFYSTTQWIDVEQLFKEGRLEKDEICYSWLEKDRWAYANYKYSPDGQEYIGNEALSRYNDLVEWNNPYSPTQKKGYELTIDSSPIRTMHDGAEENAYMSVGQTLLATLTNQLFTSLDIAILAQNTAFNYKFILVNKKGDGAWVKTTYPDSFVHIGAIPAGEMPASNQRVNYPMWFKEGVDGISGYQNNLYSLFHYIDNPRLPSAVQYSFKFTFKFNCGEYTNFDYYKTVRLIRNGVVRYGKIDEIVVDFTKRTMAVTGKVN